MARPRKQLSKSLEYEIKARARKGETAEQIAKATGEAPATISRRIAEWRGAPQPSAGAAPAPLVIQSKPDEAPAPQESEGIDWEKQARDDAKLSDVWLERMEKAYNDAVMDGNLQMIGRLGSQVAQMLEKRKKARPIDAPKLEDNPDMIQARDEALSKFMRLIDEATEPP